MKRGRTRGRTPEILPIRVLVVATGIRIAVCTRDDPLHDPARDPVVAGVQERTGDDLDHRGAPAGLFDKPVEHRQLRGLRRFALVEDAQAHRHERGGATVERGCVRLHPAAHVTVVPAGSDRRGDDDGVVVRGVGIGAARGIHHVDFEVQWPDALGQRPGDLSGVSIRRAVEDEQSRAQHGSLLSP